MNTTLSANFGRTMIFMAVLLQAIGKVMFGTWLTNIPSPLFVFISFAITAALFLALSRQGVGEKAWGPLLLLNASTALTFLSFFYALKLIEPAIVGAVEIGIGPILVVGISLALTGERPSAIRLAVCVGVLAGCALLGIAALQGSGFASFGRNAWLGLSASVAAGVGAVLITMASKSLLNRGWKFGAVLAHRFYLILPISLMMTWGADIAAIDWNSSLVAALLVVSVVGVLAPLYLLQVGIGRCDPYTVMVTMAALPVLTFIIEGFSPLYAWSWPTAVGLAIVTAFLLLDVVAKRS
ncbi:EamA family transporter [Agrobacterium tumefaciens]|uniref:EamA family transporter n=1 Tax=Agrobacterium tumefaciens TaxID=358 RepID=UPI001F2DFE71